GDGVDIRLEVLVVIVAEKQRHDARRSGAQEAAVGTDLVKGGLEIIGIDLRSRPVANADRRIASRRLAAGTARIPENALLQAWEIGQVLINKGLTGAAEPFKPVLDVGGIARFRHLSVVDQIDAGI